MVEICYLHFRRTILAENLQKLALLNLLINWWSPRTILSILGEGVRKVLIIYVSRVTFVNFS